MGEVYLAEHPRLPRRDALKILRADLSTDAEYRTRFNREAALASTLWHPHIVGVHDRGESEGHLWISMDFVDGQDAARLLADRYPAGMPVEQVTVMVKGYETLVDSGTTVDVSTGMLAAGRLQALIESRASGTRIADLMAQMDRIINAIHSSVPEELWPEILRKIDGPVAADTPADEFEDCDDADDEYCPAESARTEEDCRIQRAGRA
jgi:serine/threonine protein kinase